MLLRDLMREGRPAFPPNWQDPHSGAEPLRDDPLRGVLVEVEWGRHNLSLELKNYWRGRRLSGRLLTDDATVLPRVHALLTASIPRHLDELIDMEIPPPEPQSTARSVRAPAEAPAETAPDGAGSRHRSTTNDLHADVALLVDTLVRKGLLTLDDIDATRRQIAEVSMSRSLASVAARLRDPLDANEPLGSAPVRLTPRK